VAEEPTGFVWVEKGKLAASGYPASRSQVEWLAKAGVNAILTLTADPLPIEFTKNLGLVTGHVAMEDHRPPSVDAMGKGAEFIESQIQAGKSVLVHCLAGEGRTGCVLAAYMIRTKGMGAHEAMAEIRKVKPQFVEWRQEAAVRDFATRYLRR